MSKKATVRQAKSPNSANQYRLTADEETVLFKYRESRSALEKECAEKGIDEKSVKHYWYKSEMFSIFAKPGQISIGEIKKDIIKDLNKYSPKFKTIVRKPTKEGHCLVIDIADLHIGKLASAVETGDPYNSDIAVQRAKEGVESLLKLSSGTKLDKIVLIIGNDILHTDSSKSTTTAGTFQNTDGIWHDNVIKAKNLFVEIIEKLTSVCDVHIVHNMSNHDYMSGWFLAQIIYAHFRLCKNITFDVSPSYRKAFVYGKNLIGSTHGDGSKHELLNGLLAQEFPHLWAATTHRYIYTHHTHHKTSKDYIGVTVETVRSASSTDSWHHINGYQHAPKAIEAFLHHKERGQVARFTHTF